MKPIANGFFSVMLTLAGAGVTVSGAGAQAPAATFHAGVDLVRVAAIVRDRKGRFVSDLAAGDFVVVEDGQPRAITEFRTDLAGVSVALLFDVSGSMEGQFVQAREAATQVLSWLDPTLDEAGVFRFDTRLEEAMPFTSGLRELPPSMSVVVPFGATSLLDAVARTAERAGAREGRRRAVIVFTDGNDNASRLTPAEVSGIASAIDVPVYIVGIVASIDNPESERATSAGRSPFAGALSNLAEWTGGRVVMASTPAERSRAARDIVDELRHQYLIAFESSGRPGWHPLEVRMRSKNLVVHARSGYVAGQSRPNSL